MLAPTDIQRLKKLVDERGDTDDQRALARVVLTLFNQVPKELEPAPDPNDLDAFYNNIIKNLDEDAS